MDALYEPPAEYVCPLTKKLMQEPMLSRYGHHFERAAILKWLDEGNAFCPVTGNPLNPSNLVSNKTLQWKIKIWATKHGEELDKGCIGLNDVNIVGKAPYSPQIFLCPLTQKVMKDPVITKDGISFERQAILKWLEENDVCPVSSNPLLPTNLAANTSLQREIQQWHIAHSTTIKVPRHIGETMKFTNAGMVTSGMKLSSILRSLPPIGDTAEKARQFKKLDASDLMAVLDDAIQCSLTSH